MRKRLAAVAVAVAVAACAAGITIASAQVARADQSQCGISGNVDVCQVWQTTAAGQALATASYNFDTEQAWGYIDNTSGYSLNFWVQRNTGNGFGTVFGPQSVPSGTSARTPTNFPDAGYLLRTCFQFTWSGAAIHCTSGV
jgi:hypothetical protein